MSKIILFNDINDINLSFVLENVDIVAVTCIYDYECKGYTCISLYLILANIMF